MTIANNYVIIFRSAAVNVPAVNYCDDNMPILNWVVYQSDMKIDNRNSINYLHLFDYVHLPGTLFIRLFGVFYSYQLVYMY